ncbi:MAG: UvrD-helicase domain-containing protein [Deltaproteobacteria bacterium]|nr:UvrD-helicase domain-containing protein [Deltaproteobacteria bacterium]
MTGSKNQATILLEQDSQARRTAQTDFENPLVVEAGAGTGKTAILTARILVWCLGRGWTRAETEAGPERSPDAIARTVAGGVVALTFTDAAATEMLSRVTGDLLHITRDGELPVTVDSEALHEPAHDLQQRARALLGAVGHLRISTIHSFCLTLLRQFPIEAGLPPDVSVQPDDREVHRIVTTVVRDRVVTRYSDDDTEAHLAIQGVGADAIVEVVTHLVKNAIPDQALEGPALDLDEATRSQVELKRLAEAFVETMGALIEGGSGSRKGALDALNICRTIPSISAGPFEDLAGLIAFARRINNAVQEHASGMSKLHSWKKRQVTNTEKNLFPPDRNDGPDWIAEWAGPFLSLLDKFDTTRINGLILVEQALPVIKDTLWAARSAMEAQGSITFEQLLVRTGTLLRDHPRVAAMVRGGIHQILVDEFQDTSAEQCDILRSIALTGPSKKRPKLFLVGDPKQSIYSWRSADLAAYDDFVQKIVLSGGHKVTLHRNFRSLQPILNEVQRVIEPIMNEESGIQPPFEPLVAHRSDEDPDAPRRAVEYWTSDRRIDKQRKADKKTNTNEQESEVDAQRTDEKTIITSWNNADAEAVEAEVIARDMADLNRSGVPWNEMALLLRATTAADQYLEAFKRRDVPYTMAKSHGYYQRREVIEAAAACQTIFDPTDDVALLTLLRSPLAGVPDAALLPLWEAGIADLTRRLGSPDEQADAQILGLVERLITRTEHTLRDRDIPRMDRIAGWPQAAQHTLAAIADLRRIARSATADQFVDRMRRLLPTEPLAAARFAGPHRLANLDRFFTRLTEQMEEQAGRPRALVETLRRAIQDQAPEREAERADTSGDAVVVTTIHGAKGLGFDHVYLANIHHKKGSDNKSLLPVFVQMEGQWHFRLFGHRSWNYETTRIRAERVEEAEAIRLLYVAMTRAKNRLVLVGKIPWWDHKSGHGSLLGLLEPRLKNDPDAPLFGTGPTKGEASTEVHEAQPPSGAIRWRFTVRELEQSRQGLAGSTARTEVQPISGSHTSEWNHLLNQAKDRIDSLAGRQNRAHERMRHPLSAPASSRVASRVEVLFRHTEKLQVESDARDRLSPDPLMDRGTAMAVGTLIHDALEHWDLKRTLDEEVARQLERMERLTGSTPSLSEAQRTACLQDATHILRHLGKPSPLMERLVGLAGHIIGREFPVLGPVDLAHPWSEAPTHLGPISHVTGAIDLFYEDPADPTGNTWVVADYKTDRIEGASDLNRHIKAYRPQIEFYAQCVAQAHPERHVRMELWFVTQDRIVDLEALR